MFYVLDGRPCLQRSVENIAEVAHIAELRRIEAHAFPVDVATAKAAPLAAGTVETSEATARAAKAGRPVGTAEAVVLGPLFRIGKHLIRLVDLLEFGFVAARLVGVMFMGKFAIRLFNIVLGGGFRDS